MSDNISIPVDQLQIKRQELLAELEHINYILNNFTATIPNVSTATPADTNLSSLPTKPLIIEILQSSGKVMSVKKIWETFTAIKPEISRNGFNAALAKLASDETKPVVREVVGKYKYREVGK